MPKKKAKLVELEQKISVAKGIVAKQRTIVDTLLAAGKPTAEAKGTLRTYLSSLNHLEGRRIQMQQDAKAKRGETENIETEALPAQH
jgi:hypothetical protein